ncbi:MAG: NAD-dependent epimerase/dehydratase family protein [Microthrixaceae bacterium]
MRIVVTGANGFLGNNLAAALLDDGHKVVAADRARSAALDDLEVEFAEIDVLDRHSLVAAFDGADAVFHLAAIISITGDPDGTVERVNVQGPRNAAEAALEVGVTRFVHCSSVHAYDLRTCGPSLDETGPRTVNPHAPAYDRTKFAGEQQVRAVVARGLDAVIVNPTGVFGPRDFGGSRIGETMQQLRTGQIPVTVTGGFDFVDVRDVAQGMLGALARGRTGENYLLSGTRISIRELGQLVATVEETRPPRIDIPLGLVKPLAPLVELLTPSGTLPLFTQDSLHALEFSPAVSHYKAATELGYASRPIHVSVGDAMQWMRDR